MANSQEIVNKFVAAIQNSDYVQFTQALDEAKERNGLAACVVGAERQLEKGVLQAIISREEKIEKAVDKSKVAFDKHNTINFLEGTDEEKNTAQALINDINGRINELNGSTRPHTEREDVSLKGLQEFLNKISTNKGHYNQLAVKIGQLDCGIAEKTQLTAKLTKLDNDIANTDWGIKQLVPSKPIIEQKGGIERQPLLDNDWLQENQLEELLCDLKKLTQGKAQVQRKLITIKQQEMELNDLKRKKKGFVEQYGTIKIEEEIEKLENKKDSNPKILDKLLQEKSVRETLLNKLLQEKSVRETLLNKPDKNGELPLEVAIKVDVSREDNETPYSDALLKQGIDVKTRGQGSKTIWHYICAIEGENAHIKTIFDKLKEAIKVTPDKETKISADVRLIHEIMKPNEEGKNALYDVSFNALQYICKLGATGNATVNEHLVEGFCHSKNAEGISPIILAIREKKNDHMEEILNVEAIGEEIKDNQELQSEIVDECVLSGNIKWLQYIAGAVTGATNNLIKQFGDRHFKNDVTTDQLALNRLVENSDISTISILSVAPEEGDYRVIDDKEWLRRKFAKTAAEVGNLEVFHNLVEQQGVQLDGSLKEHAIKHNQTGVINYIKGKCGISFYDATSQDNELHIAAKSSNPDLSILDKGNIYKIIAQNAKSETPIELAVKHNNLNLADKMLSTHHQHTQDQPHAEAPFQTDPVKLALKQATLSGNIYALNMLIKGRGVGIYHTFENGETLIEVAAQGDNPKEMVQHIMSEHRRQQRQQANEGKGALHLTGINNTVLKILPNQQEAGWHKSLLESANLTQENLDVVTESGINPLSRAVRNNNYRLVELLNKAFPDLKDKELDNGKDFVDKQKPSDIARNLGSRRIANILSINTALEKSFLSKLKLSHAAEISKNVEPEKELNSNKGGFTKKAHFVDVLYEYHGILEKYAKLIREGWSLEGALDKVKDHKGLFSEQSPAGYNLPTLVAAYGTTTQWKGVQKIWNKIDKDKLPTDKMHNIDSTFGTPLEAAIRAGNEGVVNEIRANDRNADILTTAIEVGNVNLVRSELDRYSSIDDKHQAILQKTGQAKGGLLHKAIKNGDIAMVGELTSYVTESGLPQKQAERLTTMLHNVDEDGRTILHAAAAQNNPAIFGSIYNLINTIDHHNKKASLYMEHIADKNDETAMDSAVSCNNVSAVEILTAKLNKTIAKEQEVGPTLPNTENIIARAKKVKIEAFKEAIINPNCDVKIAQSLTLDEVLMPNNEFEDLLVEVAKKGNNKVLNHLLKACAAQPGLQSLLQHACEAGNIQNIELLTNPQDYGLSLQTAPTVPLRNRGQAPVEEEINDTIFGVALKNPKLTEWCGKYLCEHSADISQPLHLAAQLGDLKTLEVVMQHHAKDLYRSEGGKVPIEIANENEADTQIVLTLAHTMLTQKGLDAEQIEKVYNILTKHGYCKNNDSYSKLICNALTERNVIDTDPTMNRILVSAIAHKNSNIVEHISCLEVVIESGNAETVDIVFSGNPSLLKQVALNGNNQLFTALVNRGIGPRFGLKDLNLGQKKDWALTFAKGGLFEELKSVLVELTIAGQARGEEELLLDKSDLLQAMLEGGHATKEMMEFYSEKFPDDYKNEMLSPKKREVAQENRIFPDKTRTIPLWEQAARSGNAELADYLREDLEKTQENGKKGDTSKANLVSAHIMNKNLSSEYQASKGTGADFDKLKEKVSQIESARGVKRNFKVGYEVIHDKSENVRVQQESLIKYINEDNAQGAIEICAANPEVFDVPNHRLGTTVTDYLFEYGSSEIKAKLAHYANHWITDKDGNTPLHRLLQKSDGYTEAELKPLVSEMLNKGASLTLENQKSESAYKLIMGNNKFTTEFKTIIDRAATAEAEREKKLTSVYNDFTGESPQKLISALKQQKNPLLYTRKTILRCLDEAITDDPEVLNQRISDLKKFLNNDKDFNPFRGTDNKGNNILHVLCDGAVTSNNSILACDALAKIAKVLVTNQHFKPELLSAKNIHNESPLDILAKNPDSLQAFKALERDEKERNNTGITARKMVAGVDLNHVFRQAAEYGNIALCEHLLHGGGYRNIHINAADENGDTALFKAACNGKFDTFKYLLSEGADIDQTDEYGRTALQSLLDQLHSGDVNSLEETLKIVNILIVGGADLTSHKDKSGAATMDMIHGIERGALLMAKELAALRNKEELSTTEQEKLKFLQENENYIGATSNMVGLVLANQEQLIADEEKLNEQLQDAVTKRSRMHTRGRLWGKAPVPGSGEIQEAAEAVRAPFNKDDNFTVHIKGGAVNLEMHSPGSKFKVSEFFKSNVVKERGIRICKIDGDGYKATVQRSESGKRNYTVEEGEIKLAVKGINNTPAKLNVTVHADGRISAENDSWQETANKVGLRNVYVGGILLIDALAKGRWYEKNTIPGRQQVRAASPEVQQDHDAGLSKGGQHQDRSRSSSPDLQPKPQRGTLSSTTDGGGEKTRKRLHGAAKDSTSEQNNPWQDVNLKGAGDRELNPKPEEQKGELEQRLAAPKIGLKEVDKTEPKQSEESGLQQTMKQFVSNSDIINGGLKQMQPVAPAQLLQAISKFPKANKDNISEEDKDLLRSASSSGVLDSEGKLHKRIEALLQSPKDEITERDITTEAQHEEEFDKAILEVTGLDPDLTVEKIEVGQQSLVNELEKVAKVADAEDKQKIMDTINQIKQLKQYNIATPDKKVEDDIVNILQQLTMSLQDSGNAKTAIEKLLQKQEDQQKDKYRFIHGPTEGGRDYNKRLEDIRGQLKTSEDRKREPEVVKEESSLEKHFKKFKVGEYSDTKVSQKDQEKIKKTVSEIKVPEDGIQPRPNRESYDAKTQENYNEAIKSASDLSRDSTGKKFDDVLKKALVGAGLDNNKEVIGDPQIQQDINSKSAKNLQDSAKKEVIELGSALNVANTHNGNKNRPSNIGNLSREEYKELHKPPDKNIQTVKDLAKIFDVTVKEVSDGERQGHMNSGLAQNNDRPSSIRAK